MDKNLKKRVTYGIRASGNSLRPLNSIMKERNISEVLSPVQKKYTTNLSVKQKIKQANRIIQEQIKNHVGYH
jgi:hypothetical protein